MSDDTADQAPRPTPAAGAAARRARRIGGRPTPVPSTPEVDEPHGKAPSAAAVPQARLDKPRPAPAPPDTESDEPAPPQPATGVRSLPLAWFPAAVLAVAAVVLTGLIGVYSYRGYWAKPGSATVSTKQQETVLAAAKTCFARLNTYDYRTLDQDLAAGLACTTGTFTTNYKDAIAGSIRPYASTLKAVQVAQVNKAGISSISSDGEQWVVLIYGQLQITNTSTASGEPRIDPVGGVVTMDKVGDKWLVGKVDVDTGTGQTS